MRHLPGKRFCFVLLSAFLMCAVQSAFADSFAAAVESIQAKQLRRHVEVLASDTFEGREAGARGGRAAGVYLVEKLKKLGVKPAGPGGSFYQEFGNGYRNVLAMIPGTNERLSREVIIVCAHYDHVGYGTRQNSLGAIGYIHNGADDNASGTSGLLSVIEAFQKLDARPSRSILFAFWDAEEKGFIGSEHWVRHPTVTMKRVQLVVNIDMIGRLRKNRLTVVGSRAGYGWRRLLSEQNRETKLSLDFQWTLKRDSDHYPFLQFRVPAVMLHTGKHPDYHTPTDDSQKVNYADMQRIARLVFRLSLAVSTAAKLPRYRAAAWRENDAHRRHRAKPLPPESARLGISWTADVDSHGPLQVFEVTPNSPADASGIRPGDRIVTFNGYPLDGARDFPAMVRAAHNPVAVRLRRNGVAKPIDIRVKLNGDPYRIGMAWESDEAEPGSVYLRRVVPGTAADAGGLRVGDRVLAVSGKPFRSLAELHRLIVLPRRQLRLTIEREGIIRPVTLQLLAPPPVVPVRTRKPRR